MTKQQKVFIGIFLVVLAGLICDRTLLLPREAGAEIDEDIRIERPPVSEMTVPSLPNTAAASAQFKERLDSMLPDDEFELAEARDAFNLSTRWGGGQAPGVANAQLTEFRKKHRLKALILDGQVQSAFVDEEFVRIGQVLDGFRLVALDERSATFVAEGGKEGPKVVLEMDPSGDGNGNDMPSGGAVNEPD